MQSSQEHSSDLYQQMHIKVDATHADTNVFGFLWFNSLFGDTDKLECNACVKYIDVEIGIDL